MPARLVPLIPSAHQPDPVLAQLRNLRTLVWVTPFISDADTRARLLALVDAIAADVAGRKECA